MSSKVAELREKQHKLEQLQAELRQLEQDEEVKRDIEFEKELDKLLKKFGKSREDLLPPTPAKDKPAVGRQRRKRPLKIYVNPHTGEKVETRGGNHNVLKAWKQEFGGDEVESWLKEKK